MKFPSSRSALVTFGLATLILGGAIVACTGDEVPGGVGSPDAGSTDLDAATPDHDAAPATDGGGNTDVDADTSPDAGSEEDFDAGEPIDLDAGEGEPEPDGGPVEVDAGAGADAGPGPCNTLKYSGAVSATCATRSTIFLGGTIEAGVYTLKSVSVPQKTCDSFKVTEHGGNLVLTKNQDGSFDASFVITRKASGPIIGRPLVARYHKTLNPTGKAKGSPAAVKNICPEGADDVLSYNAITDKDGSRLTFRAPYANITATYTWTKAIIKQP